MNQKIVKVNPIIQGWVGQYLPPEHIFMDRNKLPDNTRVLARLYFRKWLVHPIKRRIAKYYLILLRKLFGLKVIGITGSAGKTTTKEMLASILKLQGKTVYSFANIDPVYNIPTTILECKSTTGYLILEMGVEFKNEMDFYLWLAKPDIGIITNVFATHTEYFGDEKGVLKEKSKLVINLSKESTAVINSENSLLMSIRNNIKSNLVLFGKDGDVEATDISVTSNLKTKFILNINEDKTHIKLNLLGTQFVLNSLAAAGVAYYLGASIEKIKKGLENYKSIENRMNIVRLKNGSVIVDDSYNNNPSAAKEALNSFRLIKSKCKRIVVFGDMLELGKLEEKYHKELGKIFPQYCDYLILVGKAVKTSYKESVKRMGKRVMLATGSDGAEEKLREILSPKSLILVKGSRSIGLDKLVYRLSNF